MSVILVGGQVLHYESLGRGKPIVLLHGWLGSWRYWVPVMETLAVDHRSYALDLWGFGDSARGFERYDLQTYVELLVSFLDSMGIDRAPLVGHTLGAAIAAEFAARYPERVCRVMAVGLPLTADAINRRLLTAAPNDTLARLFWHRQRPYPEVEMSLSKTAQNAIALTIQSVVRRDLRTTLERVDVPLLTVYGDRDNVVSASQADELENNHLSARAIILPGAHHFPMLDQTSKFARLLRDFMDVSTPDQLQDLTIKEEWRRRTR